MRQEVPVERDEPEAEFRSADPSTEESRALVLAMESEMDELYADRAGSIRKNSADPAELSPPAGGFIVVHLNACPVGCGGFKRFDARSCEIKRMYLAPEVRGRDLARRLLDALEEMGRERGYSTVRLDTGDRQPAAKRLYERAGYRAIGDYNGNPYARFWFEKEL